jgi:hypothetical protein
MVFLNFCSRLTPSFSILEKQLLLQGDKIIAVTLQKN